MSARQAIQTGQKIVKPVLSTNHAEAKRRVLSLYKAWYRQIPYIGKWPVMSSVFFLVLFMICSCIYYNFIEYILKT